MVRNNLADSPNAYEGFFQILPAFSKNTDGLLSLEKTTP